MYPHEDSTYMCIVLSTHMYPLQCTVSIMYPPQPLSVQYLSCTPHSPPVYSIYHVLPTAPQGTLSTDCTIMYVLTLA